MGCTVGGWSMEATRYIILYVLLIFGSMDRSAVWSVGVLMKSIDELWVHGSRGER
jgi:hypothetical protein